MKKVRLIYNPKSGNTTFRNKIDIVINKFQQHGYQVVPYRSSDLADLCTGLNELDDSYKAILIAGGDGSINRIINGMIQKGVDLPLGIFPSGTANDFAHHINLPLDLRSCCDIILKNQVQSVDVGRANDQYFINVACGGLLTNVSQNIDIKLKNILGNLAYYIKGFEQIPSFKAFPVRFEYNDRSIEEDIYLFLVLNGKSAGGFDKLAREASINDGMFDVIAFKACPITQIGALFLKIFRGEHLDDPRVIYFKTSSLKITQISGAPMETDLDGEKGPDLPLNIEILPNKLKVFSNLEI